MMLKVAAVTFMMSTAAGTAPVPPDPQDMLAQSWSCSPRRLCTQIPTCGEARWYLENCAWGYRLDGDSDGIPCEKLCGSSP